MNIKKQKFISSCVRAGFILGVMFPICLWPVYAEPVVITGRMVPELLGTPIEQIRILGGNGVAIPFQIDQVNADGEYICDRGSEPNNGRAHRMLDSADEIVYLAEDCGPQRWVAAQSERRWTPVLLVSKGDTACAFVGQSSHIPRSEVSYITYDSASFLLKTPSYFAEFKKDRFHFVNAGICTTEYGKAHYSRYIPLTAELRIVIMLKTLFGPLRYDEKSLVCTAKRYKVGPIRMIRRGDFHLNLGFLLHSSNAAVTQICYPGVVGVPVYVHLPIRFNIFFKEAWIEMTPVIRSQGAGYVFAVSQKKIAVPLTHDSAVDTVFQTIPTNAFTVIQRDHGFGWLVSTTMAPQYIKQSGYVAKLPSERGGIGHVGFRLYLNDLPAGYYHINNWVFFCKNNMHDLDKISAALTTPSALLINNAQWSNLLTEKKIFKRKVD